MRDHGKGVRRVGDGVGTGKGTGKSIRARARAFVKTTLQQTILNSVQTRCIVKGEARKVHFSGEFLGVFDFLKSACSLGIPQENL